MYGVCICICIRILYTVYCILYTVCIYIDIYMYKCASCNTLSFEKAWVNRNYGSSNFDTDRNVYVRIHVLI